MGGYVALHLALHHPERVQRIVTLGTKFRWDPVTAEREAARLDPANELTSRMSRRRLSIEQWRDAVLFASGELDVAGGARAQRWSIELNSPNNLKRQGWSRTALKTGDSILFRTVVTNTGDVALNNIKITNDLLGLGELTCMPADLSVLEPDASITCEATYKVTRADADAGSITDNATASADGLKPVTASVTAVMKDLIKDAGVVDGRRRGRHESMESVPSRGRAGA